MIVIKVFRCRCHSDALSVRFCPLKAGEMEVKNPLFHGDNETPSEPTTLDEGDAAPYAK